MAGGLVNRSMIGKLAPQPGQRAGVQAPAGGAYAALSPQNSTQGPRSPLSSLKTAGGPRQAPQMPRVQQVAAKSAKPAWLDAQYLSDLAGLQQGLTQQTSPIREQLTQLGFATGGFTPYQAAVRDIGNAYQSNIYGMDSSLAQRGVLASGARTVGTTKLGQERSTNLANASQEMGPAAIARLRRQIMEARQGFNQSRLAAQAGARERLREQKRIAELNKQQLAALQNQYKAPSMQSIMNAINGHYGGGGGGANMFGMGSGGSFQQAFGGNGVFGSGGGAGATSFQQAFGGRLQSLAQNRLHDYGPGVFTYNGHRYRVDGHGNTKRIG